MKLKKAVKATEVETVLEISKDEFTKIAATVMSEELKGDRKITDNDPIMITLMLVSYGKLLANLAAKLFDEQEETKE